MLILTRSAFVAYLIQVNAVTIEDLSFLFFFFLLYIQFNDKRRQSMAAVEYVENKGRLEKKRKR
jgi:hypothetical protein